MSRRTRDRKEARVGTSAAIAIRSRVWFCQSDQNARKGQSARKGRNFSERFRPSSSRGDRNGIKRTEGYKTRPTTWYTLRTATVPAKLTVEQRTDYKPVRL